VAEIILRWCCSIDNRPGIARKVDHLFWSELRFRQWYQIVFAGSLKQPKIILPTQRQLDWLVSDMADMFLKRLLLREFTKIVKPIADWIVGDTPQSWNIRIHLNIGAATSECSSLVQATWISQKTDRHSNRKPPGTSIAATPTSTRSCC
jgi:hypothetical protein